MSFTNQQQIENIKSKIIEDQSLLRKLYSTKKNEYQIISVEHSEVKDYLKKGWEEFLPPLKTKTKLRKLKIYTKKFEDDVWCQLYELGFRKLNSEEDLIIPFNKEDVGKKNRHYSYK